MSPEDGEIQVNVQNRVKRCGCYGHSEVKLIYSKVIYFNYFILEFLTVISYKVRNNLT